VAFNPSQVGSDQHIGRDPGIILGYAPMLKDSGSEFADDSIFDPDEWYSARPGTSLLSAGDV
jgi:hypothetical protein